MLIRSGAHRFGERFLKYLVALGAGFMLAAIFIEIIPESVSIWTEDLEGRSCRGSRSWSDDALAGWLFAHSTV